MKRFDNKIIYETLKEIVALEHTALVVWDVQNALVNNIYTLTPQFFREYIHSE
jgi:hypothetical protein